MDIREYYLPETVKKQNVIDTHVALENDSKYVTRYRDNYVVYYRPGTKEFHTDVLFRRLIDRCKDAGYMDVVNDTVAFVNPQMRQSFEDIVTKNTY
jgi:predicted DNA-binding protein (UPF0278 family)